MIVQLAGQPREKRMKTVRNLSSLAAIAILLSATAPLRAGVYNTTDDEASIALTPIFQNFQKSLGDLRSIGADQVDVDNPLRKRYFLMESLAGRAPPISLTLEQKLNYSAVLIRRRRSQDAIEFLQPLTRQHPEIFLFDCHLALAYWTSGQPGYDLRGYETLNEVISRKTWPVDFADLSEAQREFVLKNMHWSEDPYYPNRRFETYLLKLMKSRLKERKDRPFDKVDPLFDDGAAEPKIVAYVNDKGEFEPGKIGAAEKKLLPPDAREIVQQLLLWMPHDRRLYWQLGEIYNAQGDPRSIKAARSIFDELVYLDKLRVPEVEKRRQILNDLKLPDEAPVSEDEMNERIAAAEKKARPTIAPGLSPRAIAVTFASGLAVGIFALWQFQELRRRRK